MKIDSKVRNLFLHIIPGVCMLTAGILSCVYGSQENWIAGAFGIGGLLIAICTLFIKRKHESEIERLIMGEAYTFGFYATLFTILFLEILSITKKQSLIQVEEIVLDGLYSYFVIGIGLITVGICFIILDKISSSIDNV